MTTTLHNLPIAGARIQRIEFSRDLVQIYTVDSPNEATVQQTIRDIFFQSTDSDYRNAVTQMMVGIRNSRSNHYVAFSNLSALSEACVNLKARGVISVLTTSINNLRANGFLSDTDAVKAHEIVFKHLI